MSSIPSSKWVRGKAAAALLFSSACLLILIANYLLGAGLMGNMADRDFMTLWMGGKALLLRLDPYDPQVWTDLHVRYGSQWMNDPTCNYPLWTLVVLAPISLLPLQIAVACWMTASEMSLILAVLLLTRIMAHPGKHLLTLSALLGALLFRPFITSLTSGQLAPLLLLLLAGGAALYARGQSLGAGLLLALLLLKPNLLLLLLPAVGLLLLARRDGRGLLGLGLGIAGLFGFSWLLRPGWPLRWLAVSAKAGVVTGTPTLWGLAFDLVGKEHWMLAGTLATALVSGGVLLLVVRRREEWMFGIGLAVCGSLLVTPYLWNYDQLLLLFPALIALHRAKGRRPLAIAAWFVVLFLIPWGLFWIANRRGVDPLSGFVTAAVMAYLCVSYRGRKCRPRPAQIASPGKEAAV
jgi:hypothetical protein